MSTGQETSVYPGGWINHMVDLCDAFDEGDISESGLITLRQLVAEHPEDARRFRAGREILRGLA